MHAYYLVVQGRLKSRMSKSEVGRDKPIALEPKSIRFT